MQRIHRISEYLLRRPQLVTMTGHDSCNEINTLRTSSHTTRSVCIAGNRDFCALPYFSRELAEAIFGAQLTVLDGWHFIFLEQPDLFHRTVTDFLGP